MAEQKNWLPAAEANKEPFLAILKTFAGKDFPWYVDVKTIFDFYGEEDNQDRWAVVDFQRVGGNEYELEFEAAGQGPGQGTRPRYFVDKKIVVNLNDRQVWFNGFLFGTLKESEEAPEFARIFHAMTDEFFISI